MKRERKGKRDRGPRIVERPTKLGVTLVRRFKGSQVILDVSDDPQAAKGVGWTCRITRHVKDGQVIIDRRMEDVPVVDHSDGEQRDAEQVLEGVTMEPKVERVMVHETWEVPSDA